MGICSSQMSAEDKEALRKVSGGAGFLFLLLLFVERGVVKESAPVGLVSFIRRRNPWICSFVGR